VNDNVVSAVTLVVMAAFAYSAWTAKQRFRRWRARKWAELPDEEKRRRNAGTESLDNAFEPCLDTVGGCMGTVVSIGFILGALYLFVRFLHWAWYNALPGGG
jgi:hypothetical protein